MTNQDMKRKTPSKLEQQVHIETGGSVEREKLMYGSAYPKQVYSNLKAPKYVGKCTLQLNNQDIELELAIWERDYGLSLQGTLIKLVDSIPTGKQKRDYE